MLTNPANDYVAAFTQDVDPNRVLTASAIAREPAGVVPPEVGPRVAMRQLKELQRNELYVVRPNRVVEGFVRDTELAEAAQRGVQDLGALVHRDFPSASPDTPISELYALAVEHSLPIAVLDERGRLVGVIPRVSLLSALADVAAKGAEAAAKQTAGDGAPDEAPDAARGADEESRAAPGRQAGY